MNKTMDKPFFLTLNSILFIAGIGFLAANHPLLCAVCFLLTSLLLIWYSRPDTSDTLPDNTVPFDETDSLHIELSLKIQELTDSNKQLTEENKQLIDERDQYKKELQNQVHPFYCCPLTASLPVNLNAFFTNYLNSHTEILERRKLHCEYNCSVPDADTYLSSAALTLICNNILDNILKFSPSHATIYIRITAAADNSLIIFKNEGTAPEELEMDTLFDLNYQGSNKKSGTGLGLAQVKAIIEDFGGNVQAKRANGSGFTLYIYLPRQQSA
ncbi:MAG: GHKL domain-containing protein [Lachnospiraceae bacterium]|nr:GHKL domain-containing protein [Lachnospiraceae bacterium]